MRQEATSHFRKILIGIGFAWVLCLLSVSPSWAGGAGGSGSGFQFWSYGKLAERPSGKSSDIRYGIETGVRMMFHYNQLRVISTPPQSMLGEVQLQAWYRSRLVLFVSYGKSISQATSHSYGAGMKIPFFSISSSSGGVISGVALALVVDYINYQLDPPILPYVYPASNTLFRYGGSVHLGLFGSSVYLDGTLMVTNVNDNIFAAPLLGLGFRF